jgi:hypothetical protein
MPAYSCRLCVALLDDEAGDDAQLLVPDGGALNDGAGGGDAQQVVLDSAGGASNDGAGGGDVQEVVVDGDVGCAGVLIEGTDDDAPKGALTPAVLQVPGSESGCLH